MKQLFLVFAITFANLALTAQHGAKIKTNIDSNQVPLPVRASFIQENPDTRATWKSDGSNYKAQYADKSNSTHSRLYDKSGAILWREDEVANYPPAIMDFYTKNYPNESYTIWSRIDHAGVTTYYGYHDSDIIWFNKNGICTNPKPNKADKQPRMN